MKSVLVFALVVAAAVAAPVDPKSAEITAYKFDNIGVDGYNFAFQTSDGKFVEEKADLKNVGSENEGIEVSGHYSYIGNDGLQYSVTYVANEKGFQPSVAKPVNPGPPSALVSSGPLTPQRVLSLLG